MATRLNHELKTQPYSIGRGLSIYKQPLGPGKGSPNWYARAFVKVGRRKVHVKSTGTSDLREAVARAETYKIDLMIKQRQLDLGLPSLNATADERNYRFDVVADSFLDTSEAASVGDERRQGRHKDHRKILLASNGPCAFFKGKDIRTINVGQVEVYLNHVGSKSRHGSISSSTKRNHISSIRQVFQHAADNAVIGVIPRMPKIKMEDNPHPTFTGKEYQTLRRVCQSFERHAIMNLAPEEAAAWQELEDFLAFMVNSFVRPSEWPYIQQKHIEVIERKRNPFLRIAVVKGKVRKRVAVTMPGAIGAYSRITARCGGDPERHLFLPQYANRQTAKDRMRDRFQILLDQAGMTYDRFGKKRHIVSLRHTALTLRVLNGDNVDRSMLARNAGTSTAMLERFYCNDLEPEEMIASLQSFKSRA